MIPVLLAAAAAVAGTVSPPGDRDLLRSVYEELVNINTSYSTGQTTPAAEAIARRLLEAGWPKEDVVVLGAAPPKANVVARYRGTGAARPLLLLAHLDVVEAKPTDWSVEPFKLLEKDGYFYGRGTGDDKAQAAIWVANLLRMRSEGYRPSRDLVVALTADEEGGGPYNGVDWLLKNRRELIDAELCLNEGGWGEMRDGKRLLNLVQVGEKHSATYRLEVRNPGGHSSMPVPENAIYRLAAALQKVAALEFPFRLNDVTRGYLHDARRPAAGAGRDAAAERRGRRRGRRSARWPQRRRSGTPSMRTTCVATGLDGGHAENALPQTAGARVNCRVLPDETPDQVRGRAADRRRRRQGGDHDHERARGEPDVARARRRRRGDAAAHDRVLAGGRHAALHGHGRHRRPDAPARGHPDLRRAGALLRGQRTSASTAATSASACASSTSRRSSCTGS